MHATLTGLSQAHRGALPARQQAVGCTISSFSGLPITIRKGPQATSSSCLTGNRSPAAVQQRLSNGPQRLSACQAAATEGSGAGQEQSSGQTSSSGKVIIIYSKPGCQLCDGLRDRVAGLIERARFMGPSVIGEYELQVRDISSEPAWQAACEMEVPVLTALGPGGKEVPIPRPPPRLTTDRLQKHIEVALTAAQGQ